MNLNLPEKCVHRLLVLLEREGRRLSARSGVAAERKRLRELSRWARMIRDQRRLDGILRNTEAAMDAERKREIAILRLEFERQRAISDAQKRIAHDEPEAWRRHPGHLPPLRPLEPLKSNPTGPAGPRGGWLDWPIHVASLTFVLALLAWVIWECWIK